MLRLRWLPLALLALAQPAVAAPPMTLGEFVDRWAALEARADDLRDDDPEYVTLRQKVIDAARAYRKYIADAVAAGQPAPGCPPPPGQGSLDSDIFYPRLRTLPEHRRTESFESAMFSVMNAMFPCT
jgi:hypothetical protein